VPDSRSGVKAIQVTAVVNAELADVREDEEFKRNMTHALAENLAELRPDLMQLENGEPCYSCVRVVDMRSGSVVMDMEVELPDSADDGTVQSFAGEINDTNGARLFSGSGYDDEIESAEAEALNGAYHMVADLITYVLAPIMTALAFVL